MEQFKKNTLNRLLNDVDTFAFNAEHAETCEYAIEHTELLPELLTPTEALEMMSITQRQIAARSRFIESLGKIALRKDD